jgi:Leucine-rich repeat (LRR) protein
LERLECSGNPITDLTPLRGKPLKFLTAGGNRVTDLRPLAGLPLTELDIKGNPIAEYAPLRELRQLQKLSIPDPKNSKVSLEPLRQHPSLQYIADSWEGAYRPVAQFWADYDAQQAAGKK